MTSKLHQLNSNTGRFVRRSRHYLHSIAIFLVMLPFQPSLAQNRPAIEKKLPPPPPVKLQNKQVTESIPITIDGKQDRDPKRQYNFGSSSSYNYRVEVYGSSQRVLRKVKRIVPGAFRKRGVIQAGIFQDPKNAEDLILQLTSQGIWARIVTIER